MRKTVEWRESDFERWFIENPILPGGERLVVVDHQGSLRRVVDILCLDRNGGLVLIEVKNEISTRTALGQALEYLAANQDTTIDDLDADYEGDLRNDLAAAFIVPPSEVTTTRRVFIVAPAFDAPSIMAARFIDSALQASSIRVDLICAERDDAAGFRLGIYSGESFRRARELPVGCAISPKGRLFCVLENGRDPIVWNVGRPDTSDRIKPTRGKARTRRAVRIRNTYLLPIQNHTSISLSLQGSAWRNATRANEFARVIGSVVTPAGPTIVFAQFRGGAFHLFRTEPQSRFEDHWVASTEELPGWREIAASAEARYRQGGGKKPEPQHN